MSAKLHSPLAPYPVIEQVPKADGKGWKKPTIVDARKLNLLYSVTSMIDVESERLVDHRIGRAIFFCIVHPYRGHEADQDGHFPAEDVKEYQDHITDMASSELGEAAEAGKRIHAGVERYYEGKGYPDDEGAQNIVATLEDRVKELGITKIVPEQIIGGPEKGVVGTPDLAGFNADGKLVWLGDIKTVTPTAFKGFTTPRKLYPKWCMQLGAYDILLEGQDVVCDQILSCRESGDCKIITHDHHERWKEAMRYHMRSWFYRNDYYPWKVWPEKKNELEPKLREIMAHNARGGQ